MNYEIIRKHEINKELVLRLIEMNQPTMAARVICNADKALTAFIHQVDETIDTDFATEDRADLLKDSMHEIKEHGKWQDEILACWPADEIVPVIAAIYESQTCRAKLVNLLARTYLRVIDA